MKKNTIWTIGLLFILIPLHSQVRDYPIIDVHNHAHKYVLKTKICPFTGRLGTLDEDGISLCAEDALVPAANGYALMKESIEYFEKYDMYSILMTQDFSQIELWMDQSDRILPGIQTGIHDFEDNRVAELVDAKQVIVIGEIVTQYEGLPAYAEALDTIWKLAVKYDIPAGIHLASPGAPTPNFMTSYGNPLSLEPVLKKHPDLRVYVMHGGWPYLEETVSLLRQYPNVYLDISWISWQMPRQLYYEYLERLILFGFEKRIMFGTDQVAWPKAIEIAVQGIEEAKFLTAEQKKNIFYRNAVRFFGFSEAQFK